MTVEELRGCPLFRDIAPEDLQAMLGCLSAREAAPRRGDFILRTPDAHPLLGVVLEGEVEMISEDSFGKKSLLSVLPVGSIFGESYTCAKARNRTIAYQARTHSRVLLLDYGRILHACKLVCRFHHRMIENMVELIAEKNLTLVEKLEVVSRTTIREKLLTYLARQAEAAGARTFTIPMGRTALAEYLCTDRSAMTRELARMRDEGLIDYTKRTFTLAIAQPAGTEHKPPRPALGQAGAVNGCMGLGCLKVEVSLTMPAGAVPHQRAVAAIRAPRSIIKRAVSPPWLVGPVARK